MSEIMMGVMNMPEELFWADDPVTRQQHEQVRREAAAELTRLRERVAELEAAIIKLGRTAATTTHTPAFTGKEAYETLNYSRSAVSELVNLVDLSFTLSEQIERHKKVSAALEHYRSRRSNFDREKIIFYEKMLLDIQHAIDEARLREGGES